jgi:hypothetical protein
MVAAMSRLSRDKGLRAEREIVAAHAELGIKGERVPLSGAARYRGNGADVDLYVFGPDAAPLICEVKARASGEGFATLERWLGDADALFLRRDRADPLVVLPWQTWARLVPGMADPGRRRIGGPAQIAANRENRLLAQSEAEALDTCPDAMPGVPRIRYPQGEEARPSRTGSRLPAPARRWHAEGATYGNRL